MRRGTVARLALLVALGLAVVASGCGGGEEAQPETTTPAETEAPADTGAPAETAEPSTEPLTLRIGMSAALSGPYAAYDQPLVNGMEFAAEEINAAGGNVTVEIVVKDNKGDQTQTVTAAQELLDEGINV